MFSENKKQGGFTPTLKTRIAQSARSFPINSDDFFNFSSKFSRKENRTMRVSSTGFTLIEILISVAIVGVIAAVAVSASRSFLEGKTAESAVYETLSALSRARSLTLASKGASQYGVHFETDSVSVFKGTSFASGNPENDVIFLYKGAKIDNISLSGGGQNVIFERLSGKSAQTGTVTVSGLGGENPRVISIYETGLAE